MEFRKCLSCDFVVHWTPHSYDPWLIPLKTCSLTHAKYCPPKVQDVFNNTHWTMNVTRLRYVKIKISL